MELARKIIAASGYTVGIGKQAFHAQLPLDVPAAYEVAQKTMVENALAADCAGRNACLPRQAAGEVDVVRQPHTARTEGELVDPMLRIEAEETAKGFGFSTQYGSSFRVDLTSQPPLAPVMDALATKLLAWTGKRGRLGTRIRITFRGSDNLAEGQAELKAMLERHPELKQRLESLQELSASFLNTEHKVIGSYAFKE